MASNDQLSLQQFMAATTENNVSAKDFLREAIRYKELADYFKEHPEEVIELFDANPEKEKHLIQDVFEAVQRGNPPAGTERIAQKFAVPGEQLSQSFPRPISADAPDLEPTILKLRDQRTNKIVSIIPGLVDQYAKDLREEQRRDVIKALQNPPSAKSPDEIEKEWVQQLSRVHTPNIDTHQLIVVAEAVAKNPIIQQIIDGENHITNTIIQTVIEEADTPFPKILLPRVAAAEDITPENLPRMIKRARFETAVRTQSIDLTKLDFRELGVKGVKVDVSAGLQKLQEVVVSVSFLREWQTAGGIEGITETFTKMLGEQVVQSKWFQEVRQSVNQLAAQTMAATAGLNDMPLLRTAEKIVWEIFAPPPDLEMQLYLEVMNQAGQTQVSANQFFAARLYAEHPTLFHFELGGSPLDWILSFGKKEAAAGGVTGGITGGVTGGAAKTTLTGFGKKAAEGVGGLLLRLGASEATATAIGGWVGAAIAAAISFARMALGAIFGLGATLVSGASQGILGSFGVQQVKQKYSMWTDVALILVAVPILLVFVLMEQKTRNDIAAVPTNVGGPEAGGPVIDCQATPDDPQCKFTPCVGNCSWPASGYITQGPRTGTYCAAAIAAGNSPSHGSGTGANGIDIAASEGGPVYTPRAGNVVDVYAGCADNTMTWQSTCGDAAHGGYGNHVIIQTGDGYTLMFGHLESAIGVQAGQHVSAGAQLGWMDATGRGSGTHLHFGVFSGGNVLDFVPSGNPSLSPAAIDGCVSNTSGCTKVCPSVPVVAGG